MSMEQELGKLICSLNPYTELPKSATPGEGLSAAGANTGSMDPFFGRGAEAQNVEVEVETKYPGEWIFKGHAQRVVKAVRIRYRYPVLGKDGKTPSYWVTDYLLVGYEGGSGG